MIDLCVVSYQTRGLLQRLLDGLHADAGEASSWTLRIADNGSTDGTVEWLRKHAERYRMSVWENENVGYARACNFLASEGTAHIIGLLNADLWLATSDVVAIEQAFIDDPTVAILSPKQRNEQGQIVHAGIFGSNQAPAHRGWRERDPGDRLYRDLRDAVTVSGSAYFVRRVVWDELTNCPEYTGFLESVGLQADGAFLPTQHYYEETFCSYHARAHGHRVVYDGRVSIGHSWHASSPVGGDVDRLGQSRVLFRQACDAHGILHD